jgi:hypothetical protein
MILFFRTVGLDELHLIHQADLRTLPPRLPEQLIFYPVLKEGFAGKVPRAGDTRGK